VRRGNPEQRNRAARNPPCRGSGGEGAGEDRAQACKTPSSRRKTANERDNIGDARRTQDGGSETENGLGHVRAAQSRSGRSRATRGLRSGICHVGFSVRRRSPAHRDRQSWDEWLKLLDSAGAAAKSLDQQAILNIAMRSLPGFGRLVGTDVSVGYERARGLRVRHQTSAGDFQATVSKTLPVPLFAAFRGAGPDQNLRRSWAGGARSRFHASQRRVSNIRAAWPNDRCYDIRFNASGPDKCQIRHRHA
jgi:hypothetical protein